MKKILLALIVVCLWACRVDAQIATDTFNTGCTSCASPDNRSFVTTGSNVILWELCLYQTSGGSCSATYDGVSYHLVATDDPGSGYTVALFCLEVGAGKGSKTNSTTTTGDAYLSIWDYSGASQTCPSGATIVKSGTDVSGAPFNTTNISVANNAWLVGVAYATGGGAMTAGTGTAIRVSNGFAGLKGYDSNAALSAGNQHLSLNANSVSGGIGWIVAEIDPAAGGGAPPCIPTLSTLGVSSCGDEVAAPFPTFPGRPHD